MATERGAHCDTHVGGEARAMACCARGTPFGGSGLCAAVRRRRGIAALRAMLRR
jgi:hypothetical protein